MKTITLHESLQKVLDGLGDTPIAEPKLYKAFIKVPLKKSKLIKDLLKISGLNIKDFKALEIAKLFNSAFKKITDHKLEDGLYKVTPNTKECDLPDFEQCEDLQDMWLEMAKIEDSEEQAVLYKKMSADALKISGLDLTKLTDWETELVTQQVINAGVDVTMTALGKDLKN